jgi:hypothetical protein
MQQKKTTSKLLHCWLHYKSHKYIDVSVTAFNSLRPNCQIKLIISEHPRTLKSANLTCQSSEGVKTEKNVAGA